MSGIAGVWNLDGKPLARRQLELVGSALVGCGPEPADYWLQAEIGLACRLNRIMPESESETQPLVSPAGTALVFDGRLDNREELLAELGHAAGVTREAPDPVLVLAAYERFGLAFSRRLGGDFALAVLDPRESRAVLVRDALGVRPLYYHHAPHRLLVFASEIKPLLSHSEVPRRPNDDRLADFLVRGLRSFDQHATVFDDVSEVLPGEMVVVSEDGCRRQTYWDFPLEQLRLSSFGEYVEAFREHFTRAVRRRMRSAHPVAVAVSGGVDSSSMLCTADEVRGSTPLIALSMICEDGSAADERKFLDAIEQRRGLKIHRRRLAPTGCAQACREWVEASELPAIMMTWDDTRGFYEQARQLGARVLMFGNWADELLMQQTYLVDLFARGRWGTVLRHLREYPKWCTDVSPKYFRRQFAEDLARSYLPATLRPWLRRVRAALWPSVWDSGWFTPQFRRRVWRYHTSAARRTRTRFPTHHSQTVYESVRSWYEVLVMGTNQKTARRTGLDAVFPFLDRDLVSFLVATPGEAHSHNGVPKAILREAARPLAPATNVDRRWKGDTTRLMNEAALRAFPTMLNWLRLSGLSVEFGYVDPAAMERELQGLERRLHERSGVTSFRLGYLLGLEAWLQTFFSTRNAGEVSLEVRVGAKGN